MPTQGHNTRGGSSALLFKSPAMTQKRSCGRVAILVTDGFEQVELTQPRAALERGGYETKIVSPKAKTVRGMVHAKRVVVDFDLVTTRKHTDIPAFNNRMLKVFSDKRKNRS